MRGLLLAGRECYSDGRILKETDMKRLTTVLCLLALAACNYGEIRPEKPPPVQLDRHVPQIRGDTSLEDEEIIKDALKRMPYAVVDAVMQINVRRDDEHFRAMAPLAETLPIGHNCKKFGEKSKGIICIRKIRVGDYLIWHEATHCYDLKILDDPILPGGAYFRKEWLAVGSGKGDEHCEDPESEGFLTAYSRKATGEDIAEWVEECLGYLYHPENRKLSPLTRITTFKTDARYRKKLDLLYKYGFILESQYEKLKPLFQ